MLNEYWKVIEDTDYEVSSLGNIRNKNKKEMKYFLNNSGYAVIKLNKKHFLIHRLAAIAFIPNPENKQYVNHIDGNKLNNSISNLEWVTMSENRLHALRTGLRKYNKPTLGKKLPRKGRTNPVSKYYGVFWDSSRNKWIAHVVQDKIKYLQKRFNTEEEAAKAYNSCVISFGLNKPLNNI